MLEWLKNLKDVQGILGVLVGAVLTAGNQLYQRRTDQTRAWLTKQAEELYNPLIELITRQYSDFNMYEREAVFDLDGWMHMFSDELRPLVYRKAHLASPALVNAVRNLRLAVESLHEARVLGYDDFDEVEYVKPKVDHLKDVIEADFFRIRKGLWPGFFLLRITETWRGFISWIRSSLRRTKKKRNKKADAV